MGHDRALEFCLQSPRLDAAQCIELGLAHGRIRGTEDCGEWRSILGADLRSPRSARESLKDLLSRDRRQCIREHLDSVREVQVDLLVGGEQSHLIERVAQMQRRRNRERGTGNLETDVGSAG